jgi:hypothetical protein
VSSNPMNALPDIDEVEPVTDKDEECIREIKEVLERHGKLRRFGLTLLHNHFHLEEDEVLLESCDPSSRTLTIKPAKKHEVAGVSLVETNWRLDIPGALAYCMQSCQQVSDYKTKTISHNKLHTRVPDP